jgi:hypothetical protein
MKKSLADKFQPFLENLTFKDVLDLVKQNSQGKIWIIGGFLYKNLASALYNIPPYEYDIDFIVEHKNKELKKVDGWEIQTNRYANPNYVNDKCKMSFTDIHKAIRISGFRNPTILDFILDTPLNIQSIAYDISNNSLVGDLGISALKEKVVRINNMAQAEFYAKRKNKTLEEIVSDKAGELGFQMML